MEAMSHKAADETLRRLERRTITAPGATSWAGYAAALARLGRPLEAYSASTEALTYDVNSPARELIPPTWSTVGHAASVPWCGPRVSRVHRLEEVSGALTKTYGRWLDLGRGAAAFMALEEPRWKEEGGLNHDLVEPRELVAVDLLGDSVLWRQRCPGLDPRLMACIGERIYAIGSDGSEATIVVMDRGTGERIDTRRLGSTKVAALRALDVRTVLFVVAGERVPPVLEGLSCIAGPGLDPRSGVSVSVQGEHLAIQSRFPKDSPLLLFNREGACCHRIEDVWLFPTAEAPSFFVADCRKPYEPVVRLLDPATGKVRAERRLSWPGHRFQDLLVSPGAVVTVWYQRLVPDRSGVVVRDPVTLEDRGWSACADAYRATADSLILTNEREATARDHITVEGQDLFTGVRQWDVQVPYADYDREPPQQIPFVNTENPMLIAGRLVVHSSAGTYVLDAQDSCPEAPRAPRRALPYRAS